MGRRSWIHRRGRKNTPGLEGPTSSSGPWDAGILSSTTWISVWSWPHHGPSESQFVVAVVLRMLSEISPQNPFCVLSHVGGCVQKSEGGQALISAHPE